MKIVKSQVWCLDHPIGKPEWQYKEMNKCPLFKDQLISVSQSGSCYLIQGNSDLIENWLGGDDNLSSYHDDAGYPMEPGVYLADIQTWVYPGSYEYPEETDVDFTMENVRELDLDVPQTPLEDYSAEIHEEPPLFRLRSEEGPENYVTDKDEAPFHDKTRTPTGVRSRRSRRKP